MAKSILRPMLIRSGVLICAVVVASVASGLRPEVSRDGPIEKLLWPFEPATPAVAAPRATTRDLTRIPSDGGFLRLELSYASRVGVPKGSLLALTVNDASGKLIHQSETKTKVDAPPYHISVRVMPGVEYPLRIKAELLSAVGHRFSRESEVAPAPAAPVKIELHAE